MIFTRSSGWLSLSVQLYLKRCKILATSGHRILPFPLLWMPGETLGHRCHRSVRTPYGPPANWCRPGLERYIQQSVECLKWQVLAFKCRYMMTLRLSAEPTEHTTKAQLVYQQCQNLRAIAMSRAWKCWHYRSTTCWSFTEMSTRFTGRWKLVPLATCQAFLSSCKQLTHWHCEFRECPWILSGKVTHNFRSSSRSPAYLWFFFLLAALQLQHACNWFYLFVLSSSR